LLRWSLCKTFVHQFAVIAKPKPPPQKHKQQVAVRGALSERYEKASSALASVQ
jgi:hypothetical protein